MDDFFPKLNQVAREEKAKELFMRLVADYDDQAKQGVVATKFRVWRQKAIEMLQNDEREQKAGDLFMRLVADYDDQGKQGVMAAKFHVWALKSEQSKFLDDQ